MNLNFLVSHLATTDFTMGLGPERVPVTGTTRHVEVARARAGRVARFSFQQLCDSNLGPNDLIAIARTFGKQNFGLPLRF